MKILINKKKIITLLFLACLCLSSCSNLSNNNSDKNTNNNTEVKSSDVVVNDKNLTLNKLNKTYEDLLNTLYPDMVYRTEIENQITKSKKCIAIYVDVGGNLESIGVYIYTDVNDENTEIKELMLVSFLGTNTIYFNNSLNALLQSCDLEIDSAKIREITDKYTEYIANNDDNLSGYKTDEYSIFMSKDKVDLLDAYTVTIKIL